MEEENKSLTERIAAIEEIAKDKKKVKKLKLPRKARVKKRKLKKGWVGILKVDENGNMSGEKVQIEGSVFQTKNNTYHATNGDELIWFDGKFPIFVQEEKKLNPTKFNGGKNETYGQKYIMARMLADVIKVTKKLSGIVVWVGLGIAALIGYNLITGGA